MGKSDKSIQSQKDRQVNPVPASQSYVEEYVLSHHDCLSEWSGKKTHLGHGQKDPPPSLKG